MKKVKQHINLIQNIFWCSYFKKKKKHPRKGALRNDLLNVTPNIEQILSFELLEKTHFLETFHWIDMCNVS